ncbi:MAG: hypothetical protein AAGG69_16230 [Pseudomonadota bacterium]
MAHDPDTARTGAGMSLAVWLVIGLVVLGGAFLTAVALGASAFVAIWAAIFGLAVLRFGLGAWARCGGGQ